MRIVMLACVLLSGCVSVHLDTVDHFRGHGPSRQNRGVTIGFTYHPVCRREGC
jgi:hypothetical protein